jgi:hypothetical protein
MLLFYTFTEGVPLCVLATRASMVEVRCSCSAKYVMLCYYVRCSHEHLTRLQWWRFRRELEPAQALKQKSSVEKLRKDVPRGGKRFSRGLSPFERTDRPSETRTVK